MHEATIEYQAFDLKIAELEMQLNNAVYAVFNVTAEEIKLIEMQGDTLFMPTQNAGCGDTFNRVSTHQKRLNYAQVV